MTTFIDFRYSAAQASSLTQSYVEDSASNGLSGPGEDYLVVDLATANPVGMLMRFGEYQLFRDAGGRLSVSRSDVTLVSVDVQEGERPAGCAAIRAGGSKLGLRMGGKSTEIDVDGEDFAFRASLQLMTGTRLMGEDSGRASQWANLFYHRRAAIGLCVEVTMDWLNVHSGIPTNAISTVEQILRLSDFNIALTSYASSLEDAVKSDFYRMFASDAKPTVTLHIAPPAYVSVNPETVNVGLFVVESSSVSPAIVRICSRMDQLIVPTQFVEQALRNSGVTVPIDIIPHGVDLEFFRPVSKKTSLAEGKRFNILSVAAYSERKNIFYLARAFMEEFSIEEDIALHLYLRPEYLLTQNNLMQEFYEWERFHYNESGLILISTSYVSRSKLRDLYANADLYLLPSNEGFGFTLLESMACGTAAVGLGHGGQTDFLNAETGYSARPGGSYTCRNMDLLPYVGDTFVAPDVRHLRSILRAAFEDPEKVRRKGQSARRYVESRYAWSYVGERIIQVLRQAAKSTPQARHPNPSSTAVTNYISWMIGVIDDDKAKTAMSCLEGLPGALEDAVCLFTRYGDVAEAIRVRERGLLLYRWDTTVENFISLAGQLAKSEWVGLIYGGEKISGDTRRLNEFLFALPTEVSEVSVPVLGDRSEARFFRKSRKLGGRSVEFSGVSFT